MADTSGEGTPHSTLPEGVVGFHAPDSLLDRRVEAEAIGYDPHDFGEGYWTGGAEGERRIDRPGNQLANYFTRLLQMSGGGNVLDIGAGCGKQVFDLRQAGIDAYGCEFSVSGRHLAKERFGLELPFCDLRDKLPYDDDAFDWSYCVGVLSMIPLPLLVSALRECFRVTRYGCLLLVMTQVGMKEFVNPHHILALPHGGWHKAIAEAGGYNHTHILTPSGPEFGMGVRPAEFIGLFSKAPKLRFD